MWGAIIMICWKFVYTPFQIFKEDQEEITRLKANPEPFEVRRLEALRRVELEQFARMMHLPFRP